MTAHELFIKTSIIYQETTSIYSMNTQPIVITAISVSLTINVSQRINICVVIDANIRRVSLKLSELWITHSINWDTPVRSESQYNITMQSLHMALCVFVHWCMYTYANRELIIEYRLWKSEFWNRLSGLQ